MEHLTEFYELTFLSSSRNPYLCITKSRVWHRKLVKLLKKPQSLVNDLLIVEVPVIKKARDRHMSSSFCTLISRSSATGLGSIFTDIDDVLTSTSHFMY